MEERRDYVKKRYKSREIEKILANSQDSFKDFVILNMMLSNVF